MHSMRCQQPFSSARTGWIEVICGCMFSGKTAELIRRLHAAAAAGAVVAVFKPEVDVRYHSSDVVSHNPEDRIAAVPVAEPADIPEKATGAQVIGIDEAQFFDPSLLPVIQRLADGGARVIIAGLDMDSCGEPFGGMPQLLACAMIITKLHAICAQCGAPAAYSHRKLAGHGAVLVGGDDLYEARCRGCFIKGTRTVP